MTAVESLIKLDISELEPKKKTHEINIARISKKLHKKGLDEDFVIKVETIDADTLYDYESGIYDVVNGELRINKDEMYKKGLEVCNIAIVDPKYNDPQLINFLGVKMKQPTPDVVWKKLFTKSEIVNIGQQVIELSRANLEGNDDFEKKLEKQREKIKN